MKTRVLSLLLALALLLPCLAACDSAKTPSNSAGTGTSSGKSAQNAAQNAEGEEPTETEPDYSWFEFPEETGTLVVYGTGLSGLTLTPALELFADRYPNVKIEKTASDDDAFVERLRTEIAAGKGPDLLLFSNSDFPDIMKTISTGVFADLQPYFFCDPEISLDDYVPGVMDCGMWEGKRYLVPLCYRMPIKFTSRSILESLGAEPEDLATFEGFVSVAARFREVYPGQPLALDTNLIDAPYINELQPLWQGLGFSFIDYEKNEVCLDKELFRAYNDLLKSDYIEDYKDHDPAMNYKHASDYWTYKGLKLKECLYTDWADGFDDYLQARAGLGNNGNELIAFLLPGIDGSYSASSYTYITVPRGAENPLNGWRLLKVLLSEDLQTADNSNGYSALGSGMPVLRSALRKRVEKEAQEMGASDERIEEYLAFYETPAKIRITPTVLIRDLLAEMTPYWKGNKSFDACWDSLINTVELYKDE